MSIFEKFGSKLGSVGKFFARYADEASDIADALRAIIPAIPIGKDDKQKVLDVIDKLDGVADNVGEFLEGDLASDGPSAIEPVAVRASDVHDAVHSYLDGNLDKVVDAVLVAYETKQAEGGPDEAA